MIPYFYIIRHVKSDKYYVGSRTSKFANPDELLMKNGYMTSSRTVKAIINKDGIDSFEICRIRIFENPEDAYNYETRFLKKIKVPNAKFLNIYNNVSDCINAGTKAYKETMIERYGVDHPWKSEEVKDKIKKIHLSKRNVEYVFQSEEVKAKMKKTMVERYGVEHSAQSEEAKVKMKKTNICPARS